LARRATDRLLYMLAFAFSSCFALRGLAVGPLPRARRLSVAPRLRVAHRRGGRLAAPLMATAARGDVVSVEYSLKPDPASRSVQFGDAMLGSLPFDIGAARFVLGGGGYIDGLHDAVEGLDVGGSVSGVSIDAGFGDYNEAGKVTAPVDVAPPGLTTGMAVQLTTPKGPVQATVSAMDDETVTLDTNHPLAGCRLLLDASLFAAQPASAFATATFAGGCFWGLELAYQREPGVLSTAVGYTQGSSSEPTYEEVCSGSTGHTEAVQVVFDPDEVTYRRLCELLVERLGDSLYLLNQVGNDRGTQYRHGIYPHGEEQEAVAREVLTAVGEHETLGAVQTEVQPAERFWAAEDYHQQYLQKGGQSAKKRAEETIRCYG